ncbi:MAG: AraC family transcriptional regulator [Lentisphaerae bacterium]|nr:AraC family transcriptional regulator [Lentisphaerota bacterium]
MRTLRLDTFTRPGECCHVARCQVAPARRAAPHRHDFHEVFWVEAGHGMHILNGRCEPLIPGHLVFVRAQDGHTFEGDSTIVNVAFATARWRDLERRYPDRAHPTARLTRLTPLDQRALDRDATALFAGNRDALSTDRILLNVLGLLRREPAGIPPSPATARPAWLARALLDVERDPRHFQSTRAFAELAGRSPEHVARALRRHTGQTPTQVINAARMRFASRRIIESGDKVLEVAMACGFESLGHFYRLFVETHGQPPHAYRQHQQSIVGR